MSVSLIYLYAVEYSATTSSTYEKKKEQVKDGKQFLYGKLMMQLFGRMRVSVVVSVWCNNDHNAHNKSDNP